MKSRTNKKIKRELNKKRREIEVQVNKRKEAEAKAEYYKKRFRDIGSYVKTLETDKKNVQMLKWELKPQQWGKYIAFDTKLLQRISPEEVQKLLNEEVIRSLAKDLIENNLVQFIVRDPGNYGPIDHGTYAAKLYVVPWEQMAISKSIEIRKKIMTVEDFINDNGHTDENAVDHSEGRDVPAGVHSVHG